MSVKKKAKKAKKKVTKRLRKTTIVIPNKRLDFRAAKGSNLSHRDAKILGPVVQKLKDKGGLKNLDERFVKAAEAKSSPAHKYFNWDDASAAHEHRLEQANYYIRSIRVRIQSLPGSNKETPYIVSIRGKGRQRTRLSIEDILTDKENRALLLKQALEELDHFKNKYSLLSDLCREVDKVILKFKKAK